MNAVVAFRSPTDKRRTIRPKRTREYLTETEVDALMDAARQNREGKRDSLMILLAFRHGLRASELVDLQWTQVDLNGATLHVNRRKNGKPASHPLTGKELRALRDLKREANTPFVFVSMRGAPFSIRGFQKMIERASADASLEIRAHAHSLRHACGYDMANRGIDTRTIQDYLGHRHISNTVRYTELSSTRFKGVFHD